ncbi:PREDICTED: uncharacterized protein LOC104605593 [Nelumbo nucifera]|uniref:Uncharacterized protein LOC104605593 n=2 Tax=Nelumbo nucifera TaxID=4432 RepID=A0A1U8AR00_NELNU|nr:PREDICTED: uncharacterized protein LOC104605593 [Nelumbo nucifera]DAD41197.1 TPA_asm: hypothetical protein HUJ06_015520 [Nelumbo nucifera]
MEVVIPAPPSGMDFNFDSACSSPYVSAPSSPKRFGEFFSAPTSPTRAAAIYRGFNDFSITSGTSGTGGRGGSSSIIPFDWEQKPEKSKSSDTQNDDDDFAFDFSGQLETASLTADELFDGGVIKPLKLPPRLQQVPSGVDEFSTRKSAVSSPRSPRSPVSKGKRIIREALSPRHKKDFDPFAAAIEQARKGSERDRGRERFSGSNSGRRGTRSLSPFRVSAFPWEEKEQQQSTKPASSNSKSSSTSSSSLKGSKKWRLKDFLLFRSASEGRATDKDPFRKFAVLSKKQDDVKNSSFRSTDSSGSRRRGRVSAHEFHYTVNRAVSEELKKKTFLPYKQGLLGCLGFNPTVHGLARGFGSLTR